MRSDIRTISDLANAVKGRRTELGISQDELARQAAVSRKWINEFEHGKQNAQLRLVLAVLEALGLRSSVRVVDENEPSVAIDLDAHLDDYAAS